MDIEKMWVKFNELDVECWCNEQHKKCVSELKPECKLYLVRFIEIIDESKQDELFKGITESSSKIQKEIVDKLKKDAVKFKKELDKSLNKFKVR